jgi:hypothetical protein
MSWSDVGSLIGVTTGLVALALTLLDRRERHQVKAAAQAERVWIAPAGPSGTLVLEDSVRRVTGATFAPLVINSSELPLRELEIIVTGTTTPEVEGGVRSPRLEPHETVMPQIQVRASRVKVSIATRSSVSLMLPSTVGSATPTANCDACESLQP